MIYEYAVEPELVATWVDHRVGRYFIERFGFGQPRIVSRYPKRWKKLAWAAIGDASDLEQTRFTELLERLCEVMADRRNSTWNPDLTWLSNAEQEHARVPFHAILARGNPRGLARVLVADDVDERNTLWGMPRGRAVAREAAVIATAVASMLRNANTIILVDPHFAPTKKRHREMLRALLRAACDGRTGEERLTIEVLSAVEGAGGGTFEFFRDECLKKLPACVPTNIRLTLTRLLQRPGGEQLHNRYILTEHGGVELGIGLDEGEAGSTDDITVLDREQYKLRWRQYAEDAATFDRPEPPIVVDGVA